MFINLTAILLLKLKHINKLLNNLLTIKKEG